MPHGVLGDVHRNGSGHATLWYDGRAGAHKIPHSFAQSKWLLCNMCEDCGAASVNRQHNITRKTDTACRAVKDTEATPLYGRTGVTSNDTLCAMMEIRIVQLLWAWKGE